MKNYVLKKELPFARVGDPVERRFNNELGVWFWYVHNRNSDEDWILGCDLLIDKEKWIQEVIKPRQWTLLKTHSGEIVSATEGIDNEYTKIGRGKLAGISEIIKVQEIDEP